MPEESDKLFERTWAAIDEIEVCVKEQSVEEDEDQAYHTRVHAVAMTMVGLGLGVESIGALAICVSEIENVIEETDNLKESSADEKSTEIEQWPDTII